VAKLGWLLDHGLPQPDRWLGVPELVLWLLTGAECTEHSLAARTGAYDLTERRWLDEVVEHLGLPPDVFAPVRPAGTAMGLVSGGAAAAYGIPAGIPVTIAGHDHLAAAAALDAEPGDLFTSVGTAETLIRRIGAPPDVDRALELNLAVTVWPGGESWGVFASAARAGAVVEAVCIELGVQPGELDDLTGLPSERWTATLQELTARTAEAVERMVALTGPYGRLVVFGGGSRSRRWAEAKAARLDVPLQRCPFPDAAARGAALAAERCLNAG
jgi:xylulokinase